MALEAVISNFSFQYWKDAPFALSDVRVSFPSGSVTALLGPTNAGKSTLLHAVSGILGSHNSQGIANGKMKIGDNHFEPMPKSVLFPTVGLTIQEPYFQVSGLRETAIEEIALTLETLGVGPDEATSRARMLLDQFGLAHLASRKPFTLSGGELQRIALATIVVAHPPILLLDEPSYSLDGLALQRLASMLCSWKGGTTTVIADCQIALAMMTADHFVVLNEGRVQFTGNRKEFFGALPDFSSILPVDRWIQVRQEMSFLPLDERILRIVELA